MRRSILLSRLRLIGRDTRGVAAVEFAFLAPILILFYFSMVEFCQGYMALKRTGHVSSMVADLVSQTDSTTKAELSEVFAIGDLIMAPFSSTSLTQRVSSVTRVNSTTYKVNWSFGKGVATKLTVAEAKIPSDMLDDGESVIVAEAFYEYSSPFDQVAPYATNFSRISYLRPRTVDMVTCADC